MKIVDGKRILVTGVLTDASIAFHEALAPLRVHGGGQVRPEVPCQIHGSEEYSPMPTAPAIEKLDRARVDEERVLCRSHAVAPRACHAARFRLTASRSVWLPHFRAAAVSGEV